MTGRHRVALFGASERGRQCLLQLRDQPQVEVIGFLDNAPSKWGTEFHGLPVSRPTADVCAGVDAIVIATTFVDEVFGQLRQLGMGSRVALSPTDLLQRFVPGGVPAGTGPAAASTRRPEPAADVLVLADALGASSEARPWSVEARAACTICCNNYLAHARVLATSYLHVHPDHRFFIGLADQRDPRVSYPDDPRVTIVTAGDLGIHAFAALAFRYDTLEFTTAIKPFLLQHLLQHHGVRQLLYLDPDILVCTSLEDVFAALAGHDIALVPHILTPLDDDCSPSEVDILRAGTYNLGFIGVAGTAETTRFLAWWARRLRHFCTTEVEKGLFTDQKWADLVPSLFGGYVVLRDPGLDVAYWNLHERRVGLREGQVTVNDGALRFFHFSGLGLDDLDAISRHQNRHRLPPAGPLRAVFEAYRHLLLRAGHDALGALVPHYTCFDDGTPIPPMARRVYRQPEVEAKFPEPFGPAFRDWLRAPARPGGVLTRLFAGILALSPDLQRTFRDPHGRDELDLVAYLLAAADLYALPPAFRVLPE